MRLKVLDKLEIKVHYMNLHNEPFIKIKEQTKTIEMRLNDEKRQLLNIGDTIIFTNNLTQETITCEVINLHHFNSFDSLYQAFDKISIGYNESDIASPKDMEIYYSNELIKKYGVLGIEIKVIS